MVKKTPSETTRPPEKEPSAYQLVREHLRLVSRYIQQYDWENALHYARKLKASIQEYVAPTGLDSKHLMKQLVLLETQICTVRRTPHYRAENSREQLDKIVNMLPDYGLYLRQHIEGDGEEESDPLDIMYRLNASLDNLSLHFTEQSLGKEEMNASLKQLRRAVSRYQPQGKEMAVLRRHLLSCISDTVGEMNSVNTENPGKMTFQSFSRSAAELQHALNGFLLARDDPIHRQLFLKEVMEHEAGEEEDTAADYYASLTEDSEVREAFRQLFDEFMDEREDEDNT